MILKVNILIAMNSKNQYNTINNIIKQFKTMNTTEAIEHNDLR